MERNPEHFDRRRSAAIALLEQAGIWRAHSAPLVMRLLWRMGIRVPPPHFASFASNVAWSGLSFGIVFGLTTWLVALQGTGVHASLDVLRAALGGALFGLAMAAFYLYERRRHRLPRWSALSNVGTAA